MKQEHWNRCFVAASSGFLPGNMLLVRKKLIFLAILVGVLRIERKSPKLENRTRATE